MKKQLLESKMVEKPRTDMYTQRKTSYACSIDEKFDLQPINGYVKRNSFTPGIIEEKEEKDQIDTKNNESEDNDHQTVIENKDVTDIAYEVCTFCYSLSRAKQNTLLFKTKNFC